MEPAADDHTENCSSFAKFMQYFFALKLSRACAPEQCARFRKFLVENIAIDDDWENLNHLRTELGIVGNWSDVWEGCGDTVASAANDANEGDEKWWLSDVELRLYADNWFFVKVGDDIYRAWNKCNNLKEVNTAAVESIVIDYPSFLKNMQGFGRYSEPTKEFHPVSWCVELLTSFSQNNQPRNGSLAQLEVKAIAKSQLIINEETLVDDTNKILELEQMRVNQMKDEMSKLNPHYRLHFLLRAKQLIEALQLAVDETCSSGPVAVIYSNDPGFSVPVVAKCVHVSIIAEQDEIDELRRLHKQLVHKFCQVEYDQVVNFGLGVSRLLELQHLAAAESLKILESPTTVQTDKTSTAYELSSAQLPIALISIVNEYGHLNPGTEDDYEIIQRRLTKLIRQ